MALENILVRHLQKKLLLFLFTTESLFTHFIHCFLLFSKLVKCIHFLRSVGENVSYNISGGTVQPQHVNVRSLMESFAFAAG